MLLPYPLKKVMLIFMFIFKLLYHIFIILAHKGKSNSFNSIYDFFERYLLRSPPLYLLKNVEMDIEFYFFDDIMIIISMRFQYRLRL